MGRRTFGERGDTTNTLREMKKKLEQLKIENSRLRKELGKTRQLIEMHDGIADDNENATPDAPAKEVTPVCEKCGSEETRFFPLKVKNVVKKYLVCDGCGTRRLTKGKR
jgi:hypothetical protein